MKKRFLGKTNLEISEMGFGAWAIGGNAYGPVDGQESLRALRYALDCGIDFIDTADVYGNGHSEELVGQAVHGRREEVFLATKAGWDFTHGAIRSNFDRSYLAFALEDSLRRLKTDHVDLFQLHNPPMVLAHDRALLESLQKMRQSGKIRSYGVSVHSPDEAFFWIEHTDLQVIQIVFNLLDQRPIPQLLKIASERGIGMIAREPLACGMLTEKYGVETVFPKDDHRRRWPKEKKEADLVKILKIKSLLQPLCVPLSQIALEFVLSFPEISTTIPGMKTVEQVKANLKAIQEKYLTFEKVQQLVDLYQKDSIFSQGLYRN
ncbi:MAG: aldo/keto reductase [Chlamydiae bacterium]|nr:aldo/keto reductase [Chlamydiota bacterium]MBI3277037.1 aldo/keto reductase [Chlamydiota bacterium]